ncbi:MAG: hypothetical protein WEA99_15085 [Brumimicrobium sp.]
MRKIFINVVCIFVFLGCAKKQPTTSWLVLEKWNLVPNENVNQQDVGELTHNFTEAFVNINGEFIGVFELPAKIPVLESGECDVVITPGVRNNGISATKKRYPFVENFSAKVLINESDTSQVELFTKYYEDVKFLIEDFESASLKIEEDESSQVSLEKEDNNEILEWGNYYGSIHLTSEDSLYVGVTTFNTNLPKQGSEVYLEIDYRNSNSLLTSVLSVGSGSVIQDPYIQLNPQETPKWKKIYIDLKEIVSTRSNAYINEIVLTAVKDQGLNNSHVYLDNVKIVFVN